MPSTLGDPAVILHRTVVRGEGMNMTLITDDDMREMLTKTKAYTVVLLKATPTMKSPGPRLSSGNTAGGTSRCGPTACSPSSDPGVKAGIFTYEVHPVRSFPGAALP